MGFIAFMIARQSNLEKLLTLIYDCLNAVMLTVCIYSSIIYLRLKKL
jgi:hypothetical protein